jgi:hypothetical protein
MGKTSLELIPTLDREEYLEYNGALYSFTCDLACLLYITVFDVLFKARVWMFQNHPQKYEKLSSWTINEFLNST